MRGRKQNQWGYKKRFLKVMIDALLLYGYDIISENSKQIKFDLHNGECLHLMKKEHENGVYVFYSREDKVTNVFHNRHSHYIRLPKIFLNYHTLRNFKELLKSDYEARI